MPYRGPDGRRAALPDLEGPSPTSASALLALVVATICAAAVHRVLGGWLASVASAMPALLLSYSLDRRTRRFRLRVCDDHVRVWSLLFGAVPLPPLRVSLEWCVRRSYAREVRGVVLYAPPWVPAFEKLRFGPYGLAAGEALVAEISRRVAAARGDLSATDVDRELRPLSGDLYALWPALDPGSVTRDAWGRVASARLRGDAAFAGVSLPRGTLLHLAHAAAWRAPPTPDRIARVELGGPARIPLLGRIAQPGATLTWDAPRLVMLERAFIGAVEIEGWRVDGASEIGFDVHGRLRAFTTAAPIEVGDLTLPVGTSLSIWNEWALDAVLPGGEGQSPRTLLHFLCTKRGRSAGLSHVLRDPRRHLHPRGGRHHGDRHLGSVWLVRA